MTDDGATATGGMSGITEDTPGHAGVPGEAGSVDGVSAFGGEPETADLDGSTEETAAGEVTGDVEDEAAGGLVTGDRGGVTGTSDL